MILTEHAKERGRERARLSPASIQKFATRAVESGIGLENAKGEMLYFLKSKGENYGIGADIRVYNHSVYVMKDEVVITVLDLPKPLWVYWERRKGKK